MKPTPMPLPLAGGPDDQVIYEHTLIPKFCKDGNTHAIGMVELDAKQDARARARAKLKFETLQSELTKESIVEIDGRDLRAVRHEVETFWDRVVGQRGRSLMNSAYQEHNGATDEEEELFLKNSTSRLR